jgi:energy-coupling factor transport system substrate-specific component
MSWQAVIFAGLALVLVGGFWWYERTRPSARLVALVAALAALAIAGRLVLAPIPNVVATTDIALITGYALGAGPGFAVGALAAPVSNIWLGQGPWTAWEMAGWGLVGLGGAWLAVITHRRLGRLGLATVCALAGFAYGALLDLSVMVTYGGEQSLDRYLALSARGIPFNVAHAAGNFVIALAAGPALVRMISRFRTRATFTWRPAAALPIALLALLAGGSLIAPAPAPAQRTALAWLVDAQNADGGFAATPGQPSSPAMTGWVMLGLEAAGRHPLDVRSGGRTPVDYLRSEADRLRSVGDLERTILALAGAGLEPHRFAGADLVGELRERRDGDGSVDGQVNLTAFYALAIRAADGDPGSLGPTARWLRRAQNPDGGWGIQPRAPSEADSTGAALQGLVAAGSRGSATARAVSWLRKAQRSGGAYALGSSGVVNSQSTAWAVQGLAAAGGGEGGAGGGGDSIRRALGYLSRLQAGDGHYRYSASSDQTPIWVTAQALLAAERQPLPVPAVAAATRSSSAGGSAAGPGEEPAATPGGGSATGTESAGSASTGGPGAAAPGDQERGPSGGADGADGAGGGGGAGAAASEGTGAAAEPADQGMPAAAADPGGVPVSVSYPGAGEDDDRTTAYLLGGIAVLALILAGGYLWYRRRLP